MWTRMSLIIYRDGLVLYTVTSDATLRIFAPVLDSPQHMQLHSTLDLSLSTASKQSLRPNDHSVSSVFHLNREIVTRALTTLLLDTGKDDTKLRKIRDIRDTGWDMFMQ